MYTFIQCIHYKCIHLYSVYNVHLIQCTRYTVYTLYWVHIVQRTHCTHYTVYTLYMYTLYMYTLYVYTIQCTHTASKQLSFKEATEKTRKWDITDSKAQVIQNRRHDSIRFSLNFCCRWLIQYLHITYSVFFIITLINSLVFHYKLKVLFYVSLIN